MTQLTYELARKLKNERFPQVKEPEYGQGYWYSENGDEGVFIPFLSELIEACGDRFVGLRKFSSIWWLADAYEKGQTHFTFDREGNTPEEAVANLWIAINKMI